MWRCDKWNVASRNYLIKWQKKARHCWANAQLKQWTELFLVLYLHYHPGGIKRGDSRLYGYQLTSPKRRANSQRKKYKRIRILKSVCASESPEIAQSTKEQTGEQQKKNKSNSIRISNISFIFDHFYPENSETKSNFLLHNWTKENKLLTLAWRSKRVYISRNSACCDITSTAPFVHFPRWRVSKAIWSFPQSFRDILSCRSSENGRSVTKGWPTWHAIQEQSRECQQ